MRDTQRKEERAMISIPLLLFSLSCALLPLTQGFIYSVPQGTVIEASSVTTDELISNHITIGHLNFTDGSSSKKLLLIN